MKLTYTKEIETTHVSINISIDLPANNFKIILTHECSDCGGYGCRIVKEPRCVGGSISSELDPNKIDDILDKETAIKLKSIIQKLNSSVNNQKTSTPSTTPFLF